VIEASTRKDNMTLFDLEEPERVTKEQAKYEARQREREEWDTRRATVDGYLQEANRSGRLNDFRCRMQQFFEAARQPGDEPYKRRPNISLRLLCADNPPGKVIVLPALRGHRKDIYLNCSSQRLELLEEEDVTTSKGPAKKFSQKLCVCISPDGAAITLLSMTGFNDVRRLVATITDFLDNPAAVLARSHDRCCICGRKLTDELSRSRGIGPECIQKIDFGFFQFAAPTNGSVLVRPEQPETLKQESLSFERSDA
jgi:hypothetical protein